MRFCTSMVGFMLTWIQCRWWTWMPWWNLGNDDSEQGLSDVTFTWMIRVRMKVCIGYPLCILVEKMLLYSLCISLCLFHWTYRNCKSVLGRTYSNVRIDQLTKCTSWRICVISVAPFHVFFSPFSYAGPPRKLWWQWRNGVIWCCCPASVGLMKMKSVASEA